MKILSVAALALVLVLLALSSYLRLDHSGIGCEPWPECYGKIETGQTARSEAPISDTYQRLVLEAQCPGFRATQWHRLTASVLGLLVVSMMIIAIVQRRNRLLVLGLTAVTISLAILGIYSDGLRNPAVVVGNLIGGFLMLGLVAWLVLQPARSDRVPWRMTRLVIAVALVFLSLQILIGGLTSANFAATACPTLPACDGSWLPGPDLAKAFDLSDTHRVNDAGQAMPRGNERIEIHKLHRLSAVAVLLAIVASGLIAIKAGTSSIITAAILIALVVLEFTIGVAAVTLELPLSLAVAHNWLAALLLLVLLKLFADTRARPTA
ncbi:MAG TPA: COX15/CtaA family protein [Woeseiaceae bacterium]|nr:COX15/CtaA family protein [Woeseiaceae bacterium]